VRTPGRVSSARLFNSTADLEEIMRRGLLCLVAALAIAMVPPSPAAAQHDGGGGGGGGAGCGDVFGDLIHILRADTGQPILAQRWIEMPGGESGYGWGYCPIAVDATGAPLPFAVLSCDVAESALGSVVPVDYFGRLSGGRTKERNHRMHFNEVISNIKMAGSVGLDETGRLLLGYECGESHICGEWGVIDSPMENMALYTRLMKYGHFQTDPLEEDRWAMGDPAAGIQYNPALGPEDWAKFQPSVLFLLPRAGTDSADCFHPDYDEDAPAAGTYDLACADPESLSSEDFVTAAAALGGAANKTGQITVDLVQYMNRILKITKNTEASASTEDILPALIRDCWSGGPPDGYGEGSQDDPPYLDLVDCLTDPPTAGEDANLDLFPDALEEFVDFSEASYDRAAWRNTFVTIIGPLPADDAANLRPWVEVDGVSILEWLEFTNGPQELPMAGLNAFAAASSDTLRSIEFVHNYAVPEDLDWDFVPANIDAKFKLKKK
jgi:hypothetical protein